ncbi:BZ3501_MvSof-1269-A2-R1_Chr12-3g03731 [Microbotryum saponariae]|nr:BZ3501_MvSof-1269-A2-R1_Chr12-3g03731 [Microbotryum saponariae]
MSRSTPSLAQALAPRLDRAAIHATSRALILLVESSTQNHRLSMSRLVVANISTVLAHWLSTSSITPTDRLPGKTLEMFHGTLLIACNLLELHPTLRTLKHKVPSRRSISASDRDGPSHSQSNSATRSTSFIRAIIIPPLQDARSYPLQQPWSCGHGPRSASHGAPSLLASLVTSLGTNSFGSHNTSNVRKVMDFGLRLTRLFKLRLARNRF